MPKCSTLSFKAREEDSQSMHSGEAFIFNLIPFFPFELGYLLEQTKLPFFTLLKIIFVDWLGLRMRMRPRRL